MRRNASPEEKRAYYAERYQRRKKEIVARYKERLATDPAFLEHERERGRRASVRHYHAMTPEQRQRRIDYGRDRRNLKLYGTTTPVKGTPSLDGTRRFGVRKDETWPPQPRQRATHKPATPPTGRSPSTKATLWSSRSMERRAKVSTPRLSATPVVRSLPTPTATPKPRWTPEPINRWEPGLDRQAYREFHL